MKPDPTKEASIRRENDGPRAFLSTTLDNAFPSRSFPRSSLASTVIDRDVDVEGISSTPTEGTAESSLGMTSDSLGAGGPSTTARSELQSSHFCFNCDNYGHRRMECPERKKTGSCFNCGQDGHRSGDCPEVKTVTVWANYVRVHPAISSKPFKINLRGSSTVETLLVEVKRHFGEELKKKGLEGLSEENGRLVQCTFDQYVLAEFVTPGDMKLTLSALSGAGNNCLYFMYMEDQPELKCSVSLRRSDADNRLISVYNSRKDELSEQQYKEREISDEDPWDHSPSVNPSFWNPWANLEFKYAPSQHQFGVSPTPTFNTPPLDQHCSVNTASFFSAGEVSSYQERQATVRRQTLNVESIRASNRAETSNSNSVNRALNFHRAYGASIQLENDGRRATSTNDKSGLIFSSRPIKCDERISLRHSQQCAEWTGTLQIGVTNVDPATLTEDDLCEDSILFVTRQQEKYWIRAMPPKYTSKGGTVQLELTSHGDLRAKCNTKPLGVILNDISVRRPDGRPLNVWLVIDIRSSGKTVEFTQIDREVTFSDESPLHYSSGFGSVYGSDQERKSRRDGPSFLLTKQQILWADELDDGQFFNLFHSSNRSPANRFDLLNSVTTLYELKWRLREHPFDGPGLRTTSSRRSASSGPTRRRSLRSASRRREMTSTLLTLPITSSITNEAASTSATSQLHHLKDALMNDGSQEPRSSGDQLQRAKSMLMNDSQVTSTNQMLSLPQLKALSLMGDNPRGQKPSSTTESDKNQTTSSSKDSDDVTCIVCCDNRRDVAVVDCWHISMCFKCATKIQMDPVLDKRRCPDCRQQIKCIQKVHVS